MLTFLHWLLPNAMCFVCVTSELINPAACANGVVTAEVQQAGCDAHLWLL